jgi:hypothetical protein
MFNIKPQDNEPDPFLVNRDYLNGILLDYHTNVFSNVDYKPSFLDRIKNVSHTTAQVTSDFIKDLWDKMYQFFKKPETKLAALFSYWATEAFITAMAVYAFMSLGMWPAAAFSFAIFIYLTYATFGVIGEVKS